MKHDRPAQAIGPVQYATMILATILGNVLFVWPRHIVKIAGEESLYSLLILSAELLILGWLARRATRSPHYSIVARFVIIPGMVLVLMTDIIFLALLTFMLHELFYADTPRVALLLPLLIMSGLIGWGPITVPARLIQLWIPVVVLLMTLVGILGILNGSHWMTLWTPYVHLMPILKGVEVMTYLIVPLIPTLLILAPDLRASQRSFGQAFVIAISITTAILFLCYATIMVMLGPSAIPALHWPWVYALETISLDSTFFISRMGLAVVVLWTVITALTTSLHFRLALQGPWHLRSPVAKIFVTAGFFGILLAGAAWINTPSLGTHWILNVVDPLALLYLVYAALILGLTLVADALTRFQKNQVR